MPNRNFWNKNVLRVEYDHHVREARVHLEQLERLLAKRDSAEGFRYLRLLLLLPWQCRGQQPSARPAHDVAG